MVVSAIGGGRRCLLMLARWGRSLTAFTGSSPTPISIGSPPPTTPGGRPSRRRPTPTWPGFCKSATTAEIAGHGFVLSPGRYVGAEEVEDDGEPFDAKMKRLVAELESQFAESARLEAEIRANLRGMGYGE